MWAASPATAVARTLCWARKRWLSALGGLVLVGACSNTAGQGDVAEIAQTTQPSSSRPFPVEILTESFVDDTRRTEDPDAVRSAATRTLVTDLYVPVSDKPMPLVVHAHGHNGHPSKFSALLRTWAEAGYVVAAPAFPMTNDEVPGDTDFRDYENQPRDVRFVIDELLRRSREGHPVLGGRVDPRRIGVSGLSLGGVTVSGVAFADCCRDDRLDAAIIMDALPLPFQGELPVHQGVPLLVLHLTGDPQAPYEAATRLYGEAASPKYLVTLVGDGHGEPYENTPTPYDEVVANTSVAFWDTYLGGEPGAIDRLVLAAESTDISSLMFEARP